MLKTYYALALGAIGAHHLIETRAGIGLPGEPVLGRRRATWLWIGAFTANAFVIGRSGKNSSAAVGFANGAYQALALQHYVDWPWQWRRGVPVLTDAEGMPEQWLPAYNAALLTAMSASTLAIVSDLRPRAVLAHLAGLATLPLQLASARNHQGWLRTSRAGEGVG